MGNTSKLAAIAGLFLLGHVNWNFIGSRERVSAIYMEPKILTDGGVIYVARRDSSRYEFEGHPLSSKGLNEGSVGKNICFEYIKPTIPFEANLLRRTTPGLCSDTPQTDSSQ